jgi:hypothetical protein
MYLVSDQFTEAIRNGATIRTRADLFCGGVKCAELPVVSGTVTVDSTATVRRHCSLELSVEENMELIPAKQHEIASPGLWPTGSEIKLYQGVVFGDGTSEMIPLGVFRVSRPVVVDNGDELKLSVDGYDRSRTVSRSRFTDVYQISYRSVDQAIRTILQRQCHWLTDSFWTDPTKWQRTDGQYGSLDLAVPRLTFDRSDDPWAECQDIALSNGLELFFDVVGDPVLRSIPDAGNEDAVFSYVEGDGNLLTKIGRDLDDEEAYNGVICTGENSSATTTIPRAEVWDTDPLSPTYYDPANPANSEYGPVPYFMSSQYIWDNNQAKRAAQAKFNTLSGIIENLTLSSVPFFAHEANDIIHIRRNRVNVDDNYALESFQFDLGSEGTLDGTTRRRSTYDRVLDPFAGAPQKSRAGGSH